jgi:hypothetical protein
MTFLYQDSHERQYTMTVPAHHISVVSLGLAAGEGRYVATIVDADRQIAAQSTIYNGQSDMSTALGAPATGTLWYLAEGYTGGSFREYLTVMNPNTSPATVDVRFLPFNGKPLKDVRFTIGPRALIRFDAGLYMPAQSISAIVTADKGWWSIAPCALASRSAARTMRWVLPRHQPYGSSHRAIQRRINRPSSRCSTPMRPRPPW